jgi:hypothetical protein
VSQEGLHPLCALVSVSYGGPMSANIAKAYDILVPPTPRSHRSLEMRQRTEMSKETRE